MIILLIDDGSNLPAQSPSHIEFRYSVRVSEKQSDEIQIDLGAFLEVLNWKHFIGRLFFMEKTRKGFP